MNLEKKIVTFFTVLIVLVGVPYCIYLVYINHQDDLYKSMVEYDCYTTVDGEYDVSVRRYASVSGGDEVYHFKVYLVNKATNDVKFIKNVAVSSYSTEVKCTERKVLPSYDITVTISSSKDKDTFVIDVNEMRIKGQKIRAVF